jgi:hypothetical protein
MHHLSLDRPGPHDRDLDDEIVESAGLSRGSIDICARLSIWKGADRVEHAGSSGNVPTLFSSSFSCSFLMLSCPEGGGLPSARP